MFDMVNNVVYVAMLLITLGTNQLNIQLNTDNTIQEHMQYVQRVIEIPEIPETPVVTVYQPETATGETYRIASIIEGEAPIENCGFNAQLAVAWVYSRNTTMYGYRTPSDTALEIARTWHQYNDPTGGSFYMVNTQDLQRADVRKMTGYPSAYHIVFPCAGLNDLYVFPTE